MIRASLLTLLAGTIVGTVAQAAPPWTDACRAIADPQQRLACFDRGGAEPVSPAVVPPATPVRPAEREALSPAPAPAPAAPVAPAPASVAAPVARRTFDSTIAAVEPLRHGMHQLTLADGTRWTTTVAGPPPAVGAAVHFRRTILGTRFFDLDGGPSLTVRPRR